jgi:hypothetical protein
MSNINNSRHQALRRVYWRAWRRGLWTGVLAGALMLGTGIAIGILTTAPALSSRPDVISAAGIAIGGSVTAAISSMAVGIGTLLEYRRTRK